MKGVTVFKAKTVSSDDRRDLIELINGQMSVRNVKILNVKKDGVVLGGHCHSYSEFRYLVSGKARFICHHLITEEQAFYDLEEGDVMIVGPWVRHEAKIVEPGMIIEGAAETYVNAEYNDVK